MAAYVYSVNQERVYEAKATLLVQQRNLSGLAGFSDFRESGQLAATYASLAGASPFLDKVLADNGLARLGRVSIGVGTSPPRLHIRVRDRDPSVAARSADVISRDFIDYAIELRLGEIARLQAAAAAQGIIETQNLVAAQFALIDSLTVLEPVSIPSRPILPRTRQNVLLGVFLGAALATGAALILGSLRDTVRSPEELRRRFGVTGLGTVFKWPLPEVGEEELVVWKAPSSGYAESFKQIRTNLQFAAANHPGKVFVLTSPGPGEGKSTILSNLAITLAQTGQRVTVIDCDLRRPSLHRLMALPNREPGLSNFLAEPRTHLDSIIHGTQMEGVSIIPAGPLPPNPSELLGSNRMSNLLEGVQEKSDIVLLDSPPLLLVADGPLLASQSDGTIIVVDGFSTRSSSLREVLATLERTQAFVVGVVINKLKRSRFGYGYGYDYPYYYSDKYYKYYRASDPGDELVDGAGPIHRRPLRWVRSTLSRFRLPSSRS